MVPGMNFDIFFRYLFSDVFLNQRWAALNEVSAATAAVGKGALNGQLRTPRLCTRSSNGVNHKHYR
jgi:hypothetical protein